MKWYVATGSVIIYRQHQGPLNDPESRLCRPLSKPVSLISILSLGLTHWSHGRGLTSECTFKQLWHGTKKCRLELESAARLQVSCGFLVGSDGGIMGESREISPFWQNRAKGYDKLRNAKDRCGKRWNMPPRSHRSGTRSVIFYNSSYISVNDLTLLQSGPLHIIVNTHAQFNPAKLNS